MILVKKIGQVARNQLKVEVCASIGLRGGIRVMTEIVLHFLKRQEWLRTFCREASKHVCMNI